MGHYNYDIDDRDSESNFENPYHNPVMVQEQRGRDKEFQHEEDVDDHPQCFIDWNSQPIYDIYHNEEDLLN